MRQRFEQVTRNHHPRRSYEAEIETAQRPPTYEHLKHEIERIVEVIDDVLEESSDLSRRV